jgi:hypothetical protein
MSNFFILFLDAINRKKVCVCVWVGGGLIHDMHVRKGDDGRTRGEMEGV